MNTGWPSVRLIDLTNDASKYQSRIFNANPGNLAIAGLLLQRFIIRQYQCTRAGRFHPRSIFCALNIAQRIGTSVVDGG